MKLELQGILSLILITSSSVLCRRIQRPELGDGAPRELSNLPEPVEKNIKKNESENFKPETINVTTPGGEIFEENIADVDSIENESFDDDGKLDNPISKKRIQKMLKKAIIQIITGDLTTADMKLLKSLNYDAEQVRMIREEEFKKRKNKQNLIDNKRKPRNRGGFENDRENISRDRKEITDDWQPVIKQNDYEEFNNKATLDYENADVTFEATNGSWIESGSEYEDYPRNSTEIPLGKVESHDPNIVFTIRYNDSEFDSSSEENPIFSSEEHRQITLNGTGNNFPATSTTANSTPAPVDDEIGTFNELWSIAGNYFSTTDEPIEDNDVNSRTIPSVNLKNHHQKGTNATEIPDSSFRYKNIENSSVVGENDSGILLSVATLSSTTETPNLTNSNSTRDENSTLLSTRYKGLRWVQDNVYQVLPEYIDSLSEIVENDTSDSSYDDTIYQNLDEVANNERKINDEKSTVDEIAINDSPDSTQQQPRSIGNVTVETFADLAAFHRRNAAQRQAQRQKTEADIKSRVLIVTGRLNTTTQPRTEKLAMYSPTCSIPQNTNTELWHDPYAMNMHFQLNLTTDQHLAAAKLRIYKLPQENLTVTTSSINDGVENEEKKIRISVYYYLRSLKKTRPPKKLLMDSKVTSLTGTGEQIALDVKDAAIHWRSTTRNTNHGLVILVEDQEGHPLQPVRYVQRANCHDIADPETQDDKAYQRFPALFIRACTRYVRFVNDQVIAEEFCEPQSDIVSSQRDTMQNN